MYLHRLFWFFFLALKRKIRQWWPVELLARPESGCCCVGAAVVLGCVAVTQIIRKLEEPVSVRCGMQPKYRIAVRKKQRDLLQISLGQIIDPGPVIRLCSIPRQWYTFITRCEIHGYNKCLHCFFCFFGFFWPYLISKCRIQVQIQIYRYICAPFGQTLTCWLSETERERERGRESWPSGAVWVSGSICVRRSSYSATPNNPSSSRSRDPSPHSLERNDRARLSRQKQHKIQARNERYKAEQPVLKFSKRPETTLPVTVPPPQIAFHFRRENDSNPLAIPTSASEV